MWWAPVRPLLRCDLLLVVVMVPLAMVPRASVLSAYAHELSRAWRLRPLAVAVAEAASPSVDESVVLE